MGASYYRVILQSSSVMPLAVAAMRVLWVQVRWRRIRVWPPQLLLELPLSAATDPTIPLLALLLAWPTPVYVVIDGAKYLNLPELLAKQDIAPRSLFVEQRD